MVAIADGPLLPEQYGPPEFECGREAARKGLSLSACPFQPCDASLADFLWQQGFDFELAVMRMAQPSKEQESA